MYKQLLNVIKTQYCYGSYTKLKRKRYVDIITLSNYGKLLIPCRQVCQVSCRQYFRENLFEYHWKYTRNTLYFRATNCRMILFRVRPSSSGKHNNKFVHTGIYAYRETQILEDQKGSHNINYVSCSSLYVLCMFWPVHIIVSATEHLPQSSSNII